MVQIKMIAWFGGATVVFFLCVFLYVIQVKIQKFNQEKVSPLPLEGFLSISSYLGTLVGLTVMFTGVFQVFFFSARNSLIAAFLIALFTGLPMWGVTKGLLEEIKAGELKEIVPGKF